MSEGDGAGAVGGGGDDGGDGRFVVEVVQLSNYGHDCFGEFGFCAFVIHRNRIVGNEFVDSFVVGQ